MFTTYSVVTVVAKCRLLEGMEGRKTNESLVFNDADAGHSPDLAARQRRDRPQPHDLDEMTLVRPGSVTASARRGLAGAFNNNNTLDGRRPGQLFPVDYG